MGGNLQKKSTYLYQVDELKVSNNNWYMSLA